MSIEVCEDPTSALEEQAPRSRNPATVAEARAQLSRGISAAPIYRTVGKALSVRHLGGGILLDVGCGCGELWPFLAAQFQVYHGADVVRYEGFPATGAFHRVDLDTGRVPLADGFADVVAAVETIEHLENPRAFMRELVRLARPGGWIVVTTPNQLSLLSKLTLLLKNQFNAFQDSCYPAHVTALLESDLRRIAAECGLTEIAIAYTSQGRIPGLPWHYPSVFSRLLPRLGSDNVILLGRAPGERYSLG